MIERDSDFAIRLLTRPEVEIPIEWAAQEGWNPGLGDAAAFYAADPGGFLMGFVGAEPVASLSVVRYGSGFAFLGLYIVPPEHRGRGYGRRVWRAGMRRLEGRVVGLDGVIAQQANYARSGFRLAHRNIRYGGVVAVERPVDPRVRSIEADIVDRVVDYDRRFFPERREAFLRSWLEPEQRSALAFVQDRDLKGYGVLRQCRTGFKIGPLFAETEAVCETLFLSLAAMTSGQMVYLDLPEPNASALRLASRFGLSPIFETARMYQGPAPDIPLGRIYGITTFELG